ncbi:MAG: hypothetical protein KAI24_12295 [Planctomycetes bacterium]|nr:hypothetical protein [Planctomycetota bacterium]
MDQVPTPEQMHELVRPLDDLDRKVLGGLVALWMAEPDRIRDREWTAQQFVHVATVAHGFDGEAGPATTEDVERIRTYAQGHMEDVVRVGLSLFVRVAHDLQQREGGFSYENAKECVRGYLEPRP